MSTSAWSKKLYSPEAIVRAFSYFATTRSLYKQMREDYQFPSISTLTKITSSCAKQTSGAFLKNVFHSLETKQKICILLHDEINIKKILQAKIFGKAENDTNLLAETMLGLMINSLHGGPKFLLKMIPVAKLNAEFLREKVYQTIYNIEAASGKVKAIISDGIRINQSFFNYLKQYKESLGCQLMEPIYCMTSYVHLIKNIRNLWLTEKTDELKF